MLVTFKQYSNALSPMLVIPFSILTDLMLSFCEYQGATFEYEKLFIFPLPEIVSTPVSVSSDQVTFSPQAPLKSVIEIEVSQRAG